jgi:hypothetical protein
MSEVYVVDSFVLHERLHLIREKTNG